MDILSVEKIIKDKSINYTLRNSGLFVCVGCLITFLPLIYIRSFNSNALIGTAICFLCFGLPLGYYCGIRNYKKANRTKKALLSNDFIVLKDQVKTMRMLTEGVKSDNSDRYCQLEFCNFSEETGKCVTITRRLFDKTKEGDDFFLICFRDRKNVIEVYSCKQFILDENIQRKLV